MNFCRKDAKDAKKYKAALRAENPTVLFFLPLRSLRLCGRNF
jgi:hypothetical protein